ncbi:MAG TPA: YslB family protein [Bacillota bacterium]|nr:YslB family protein [Bacillota bacterium]
MAKNEQKISIKTLTELESQTVGYDILRYISLPNLLGKESETILYYMGKNLARSFELNSLDDIHFIFERLGWGYLELLKQRRNSLTFSLMADSVARRLQSSLAQEFRLEAGFLAEATQIIHQANAECVEKINKNIHQVQFKVVFVD